MINIAQETLGLRRTGFSPVLSLLIAAYSLHRAPAALTVDLQRTTNASLPMDSPEGLRHPSASVHGLSPGTFSAQNRSTGELLRTL